MQITQQHGSTQPIVFGIRLLDFYRTHSELFIEVEDKKRKLQQLLRALPRNRNYRTVPCKTYHMPFNGGFCPKGDSCNFIHCEEYRG